MFQDNPNFKKLDEEIYVWENFLSPEEHQRFFDLALSISEEEWMSHVRPDTFWSGKCNYTKKEVYEICNRINRMLEPEYVIPPSRVLHRTPIGKGMHVHADRGEEGDTEFDDYGTHTSIDYGVLVYIGDWKGGELYYPNRSIEFQPKPGSLIIHSAFEAYAHGVKPVTSGKRFFYANFISLSSQEYINPLTGLKITGALYV